MMKIAALFLAFVPFLTSFSQPSDTIDYSFVDYNTPREYILADINISGVKYLQPAYLVNISGLSIGQEIVIPGDEITKAIEKFWDFGLFSDVKVIISKIEGNNVYLEIQLAEQSRLSRLQLLGINSSEAKEINEKINFRQGNQVTENILNNAITTIKKYYIDRTSWVWTACYILV